MRKLEEEEEEEEIWKCLLLFSCETVIIPSVLQNTENRDTQNNY
jgi:hypothetical protein